MEYNLVNFQGRARLVIFLFLFVLVLVLMPQIVRAQVLDPDFNPNANGNIWSMAIQADGKIIIGGEFTQIGGVARSRIARINPDGSLDTTFNPNVNRDVWAITIQADGKILIGGEFTRIGVTTTRNHIARLNPDGSLDTTFNPNASGTVRAIALQSFEAVENIIIGGIFTEISGVPINRIARLNPAGALDTTFNPNANMNVQAIAIHPDGNIIIGGEFNRIGGVTTNRIARLHPDGTHDTTFNPDASGLVRAIAIQADGNIIIGGAFTTIGGEPRSRIARLHPAGTLDPTFNPNAESGVYAIAIQPDGNIIIGGTFAVVGGVARSRIARLNSTGTVDPTFDPNANTSVRAINIQADGNIIIGGTFSRIGGIIRNNIARLIIIPILIVETLPATDITDSSANLHGTIISDGGAAIIAQGFEWRQQGELIWNNIAGIGGVNFSAVLGGLAPNIIYEFRAWAENTAGTAHGAILSFSILFIPNDIIAADGFLAPIEISNPHVLVDDTFEDLHLWDDNNVINNLYVNIPGDLSGIVLSVTGRVTNSALVIYIATESGGMPVTPSAIDFSGLRGWTGIYPRNLIVDTTQTDGQGVNFYAPTWNTAPGGDPSRLGTGDIAFRQVNSETTDIAPGAGVIMFASAVSGGPAEWFIPFSVLFPGIGAPGVVPANARVGFAAFVLGDDNWSGADAVFGTLGSPNLPHNWPEGPDGGGEELGNAARINNFQWLYLDPEGDGVPVPVELSEFTIEY